MAFSAAFSPAFVGAGGLAETGIASVGLAIDVYDPAVFDTAPGWVCSLASVTIGGVDVSARLLGQIEISAEEDAARLASLTVIPASVAELNSYDSADIQIELTLSRDAVIANIRRFTGIVEQVEFNPVTRTASLTCRDGYQERPRACPSAADVEALFSGLAWPHAKLIAWNADAPDPMGYFSELRETFCGTTFIDSLGLWRAVPWDIDTPWVTYGANDIFDGSLSITRPSRADLPASIRATLTHRFPRLHNAEVPLTWTRRNYVDFVEKGILNLDQATMMSALNSISGWKIRGEVSVVHPPAPYFYQVNIGGNLVYYTLGYEAAQTAVDSFSAVIMRRWYQDVSYRYVVDIPMGGSSSRDDSVAMTIASTFDTGAWESSEPTAQALPIFTLNTPPGIPVRPGYEGMMGPFPPANGGIDHFADLANADVEQAIRHTVARALRKASAGKRRQVVQFSRPLDPRWEIGAVLGINAYGVTAIGQVVAFRDTIDIDSGECVSDITLACPDGTGSVTGQTTTVSIPTPSITHNFTVPPLLTHIGADSLETPAQPNPDLMFGWLTNTTMVSLAYSLTAPHYELQFRVFAPEIAAAARDPLVVEVPIAATVDIAGSGITLGAF